MTDVQLGHPLPERDPLDKDLPFSTLEDAYSMTMLFLSFLFCHLSCFFTLYLLPSEILDDFIPRPFSS